MLDYKCLEVEEVTFYLSVVLETALVTVVDVPMCFVSDFRLEYTLLWSCWVLPWHCRLWREVECTGNYCRGLIGP